MPKEGGGRTSQETLKLIINKITMNVAKNETKRKGLFVTNTE